MRIELEALQPQLQESAKQTAAMLADIEIQSRQAGETREVVVAEEAVVNAKAIDANKLKVNSSFTLIFAILRFSSHRKNANTIYPLLCLRLKLLSML
jgi:dynein heavy chain